MKKTCSYFFFLLLIVAGTACKKDDVEPPPIYTPPNDIIFPNVLAAITSQYIVNDLLTTPTYESDGIFYKDGDTTVVKIDSLSLNGINIPYVGRYYQSFTPIGPPANRVWVVKGNNGIPSFSYTCSKGTPGYAGYASLPDSIDRTKELKILMTGISNSEEISAHLVLNNAMVIGEQKRVTNHTASTWSVTFAADELNAVKSKDKITIEFYFSNEHTEIIGGQVFSFLNTTLYYKDIYAY